MCVYMQLADHAVLLGSGTPFPPRRHQTQRWAAKVPSPASHALIISASDSRGWLIVVLFLLHSPDSCLDYLLAQEYFPALDCSLVWLCCLFRRRWPALCFLIVSDFLVVTFWTAFPPPRERFLLSLFSQSNPFILHLWVSAFGSSVWIVVCLVVTTVSTS